MELSYFRKTQAQNISGFEHISTRIRDMEKKLMSSIDPWNYSHMHAYMTQFIEKYSIQPTFNL